MKSDPTRQTILVIEDDAVLNGLMSEQIGHLGYHVLSAEGWRAGEVHLAESEPDLILLDLRLPDADGLELISRLAPSYSVIVLTAYGSIENAVSAIKNGAVEYLTKPINMDELELEVARALENAAFLRDYQFVKDQQRDDRKTFMVGASAALREVIELIEAVAKSEATVLIQGESGVGKELVAREIHRRSSRSDGNFVALDCCTLQDNLFESELFGHEKGAFTGATSQKRGLIEGADGGTLFLDEIGEISPAAQAKLLRIIETGGFRRVGGLKNLTSNARILAATNRDLRTLAREGTFRSDLYYRLSAFVITVPPLSERRQDIPALAAYFLANHDFSRRIRKELSVDAVRVMVAYDWPGNVRELRNVIERAMILSGNEGMIRVRHLGLPAEPGARSKVKLSFAHEPTLEEITKSYLETLIVKHSGHRARLASTLGISERNLYRLIKKYDL